MATRHADSFEDNPGDEAGFRAEYNLNNAPTLITGRRAGTSAILAPGNGLAKSIGGTEATIFTSFAYKTSAFGPRQIVKFREGSIVHVTLLQNASGRIEAYRGDSATLLGTSSDPIFTLNNWRFIQSKAVIHDSAGVVEVRDANGTVLLNLTGQDTKNGGTGYIDDIVLCEQYFDDWHVWDTTGSICNTWTNDTRIDHVRPSGAGDAADFTASAGSNYQCVDEAAWNTSDYVSSSTPGDQDLYAFSDISHNPVSIFSVLRAAVAQKDDAGSRSLKLLTKSGATVDDGSAHALDNGSYIRHVDVVEADPNTSAAWTQTNINAAQHGVEVV